MIDLVGRQAMVWSAEAVKGEMYDTIAIPTSHEASVREWRDRLLETIAENDDEMMELYLEGDEPSEEQLIAAIRRATIAGKLTPVLCGSASTGCAAMLDAVVRYLPSPIDVGAVQGHAVGKLEKIVEREPHEDAPLATLAFKIMSDPHLGKLTYLRIYSCARRFPGAQQHQVAPGADRQDLPDACQQAGGDRPGDSRPDRCGDGAEEHRHRRHALCGPEAPVILESMSFPAPVIHVASSPGPSRIRRSSARRSSVWPRRTRPSRSEPTRRPTIIAGMGELHLDILVDRMRREFRVEANVGKPQVAYRETIRRKVDKIDYTHKKQTGEVRAVRPRADQHRADRRRGRCAVRVREQGHGRSNPEGYIPSVDAGCQEAMDFGVLASCREGRREGDAAIEGIPRGSTRRARVQDRRFDGVQGCGSPGGSPSCSKR